MICCFFLTSNIKVTDKDPLHANCVHSKISHTNSTLEFATKAE